MFNSFNEKLAKMYFERMTNGKDRRVVLTMLVKRLGVRGSMACTASYLDFIGPRNQ